MIDNFEREKAENIHRQGEDTRLRSLSLQWITDSGSYKYIRHFTWMGRPIIELPQDILAMQEIIWDVKPDLIVETGVARGGSLIFYASMLELLGGDGHVIGVEIDLRDYNRPHIVSHPMFKRITILEGSSVDPVIAERVHELAAGRRRVMVLLDSNHVHAHVLQELKLYSPLVKKGSYLVVFDTVIEDLPPHYFPDRPWDVGNNPQTAVREFLASNDRFVVDHEIDNKLLISCAPGGFLKCLKD
jgi:cephalosporin hydroxylase